MEVLAFSLQEALRTYYGYDFLTVTSVSDRYDSTHDLNDSSQIVRLPYDFKVFSTPIGLTWMRTVRNCIEEFKPDLILCHTPVPFMADIAVRVARERHLPSVVMCHGDLSVDTLPRTIATELYWNAAGRRTFQLCDLIFVTTQLYATRSRFLRRFRDKVSIVPPCVDTTLFRPALHEAIDKGSEPHARSRIMFVGQLERVNRTVKGLDTLFRAFVTVSKEIPGAVLVVVGDGSAKRYYMETAQALGILEKVHFTGKIAHDQMPGTYSGADVLCLPSTGDAESLGLVLLEAQACGIPVVASAVGGIPAVVRDGETGLLVTPGPDSLANALCRLLKNQPLRQKMGEAGARYIRSNFSDRATADAANKAIIKIAKYSGFAS